MLKTISAALLAASVIAAPAFATETTKTTTTAPVIKADQTQTKVSKPDAGAKADSKAKSMNANAAVTPAEHKSVRTPRHHHKQVSAKKSPKAQPDVTKPAATDKRS